MNIFDFIYSLGFFQWVGVLAVLSTCSFTVTVLYNSYLLNKLKIQQDKRKFESDGYQIK